MREPVAVLNRTQQRLLACITASGLFRDEASILTAACVLAKKHSDKVLHFKGEVERGLGDIRGEATTCWPIPSGTSKVLPWAMSKTAVADMDEIERDDPVGKEGNPYKYFLDTLTKQAKRPSNFFARSYLPPATRLLFVWPYVAVVRFTPERNELLRVLHSSVYVPDVALCDQSGD